MKNEINLTIEDIHNIRYENYEKTRNMPFDELVKQTAEKAQAFKQRLKKYAFVTTETPSVTLK